MFHDLDSGLRSPGLSPSQGHCVVLSYTLISHTASLQSRCINGTLYVSAIKLLWQSERMQGENADHAKANTCLPLCASSLVLELKLPTVLLHLSFHSYSVAVIWSGLLLSTCGQFWGLQ